MLEYLVIDAFTARPFAGNPAAVVLERDDVQLTDTQRQRIAAEFNRSETAFLAARDRNSFDIRWFTPTVEVDLCGHATLASTHALLQWQRVDDNEPVTFHRRAGSDLRCHADGDWRVLAFPALHSSPADVPANAATHLGLNAEPLEAERNDVMLTLRLPDEAAVRRCTPDSRAIAPWHAMAVCVTAHADETAVDFVSRFFAPNVGIPEDPVTGAAHCGLAPFWHTRLKRDNFVARQLSSRGGEVHARLLDSERVELRGRAVTVFAGQIAAVAL